MPVVVLPTAAAVAEQLADRTAEALRAVLTEAPRATLCLTGGSTPPLAYARLATATGIAWDRVYVFWGDERAVPPASPDSNAGMAQRTLIGPAGVPDSNVYRIEGERGSEDAAKRYEAVLEQFFGDVVRFDVLHLGMGPDGHTASLFPGRPALTVRDRRVVATEAPDGMAVRDRVTLTIPALGHSAVTLLAAAGATKRDALAAAFSDDPPPAGRVYAQNREMTWLLDAALATGIAEASRG